MTSYLDLTNYFEQQGQYINLDQLDDDLLKNTLNRVYYDAGDGAYLFVYDLIDEKLVTQDHLLAWYQKRFAALNKVIGQAELIGFIRFKKPLARIILARFGKSKTNNSPYLIIKYQDIYGMTDHSISLWDSRVASLWWLDSDEIYNGYKFRLRINKSLDGIENLDESFMLNYSKLLKARDFLREEKLYGYPNLNLTYSTLLKMNACSRTKILVNNWKKIGKLSKLTNINLNKFSTVELLALANLRTKVTDLEFKRVVNWLHGVHNQEKIAFWRYRIADYWKALYVTYLTQRFMLNWDQCENLESLEYEDPEQVCLDYINQMHAKRKLMQINYYSWRRFKYEERELANQVNLNQQAKYWGLSPSELAKETFSTAEKWQKLRANVTTVSGLIMVDTFRKLGREGNEQHNCVATYLNAVRTNESAILDYQHDGERYTVEVKLTKRKRLPYKIVQMYATYNESVSPDIVRDLERKINGK